VRERGPHKAFALYAHLTWHTRWREHCVEKRHVDVIADSVLHAAQRHNIRVLAQSVLAEHVHILVSYRPDCTLAAFVRDAKSESSRRAGDVTWCRGYYAGSVCADHIAAVRAYIARQYTRHPDRIPRG